MYTFTISYGNRLLMNIYKCHDGSSCIIMTTIIMYLKVTYFHR